MHPTMPYLLSSSDDMLIKLWDWEKGWILHPDLRGPLPLRHAGASLLSNSAC